MLKLKHIANIIMLSAFVIMAGCSSSDKYVYPKYTLQFISDEIANTGSDLRATPVKIRVYQLRSSAQFLEADFFSLQGNAKAVLGESLVESEQFFLLPGEQKELNVTPPKDTRVLGVVAEYQRLDGKRWRVTLDMPQAKEKKFYKPWPIFPNELNAEVKVRQRGLVVTVEKEK